MKRPFLLIAVLSLLLSSFSPVASHAVTASDWQAGNIMDDTVFTNSNAMSVAQIQSWLNARLANCDYNGTKPSELKGGTDYDKNGVVTRAEYGRTIGNPAPFTCLNQYYEVPKTSPSKTTPASNYGKSARPAGSKSAAQLIYDAGKAYGISPKVLLVKLATESAGPLTSDVWPLKRQYTYAMGARCPDSGPGGSANCDVNYSGFSMQMREAASLMRWYLDSMDESWWSYKKPYATNHILWNVVERGCGGKNVYIKNKATAALYTYTPYQPNAAALQNMYGTGNNCSAYGNRNFWRVYSDWFGSTYGYTVKGAIGTKYKANPELLGQAQMNERCGLVQKGCYQKFQKGYIYWTSPTGAWITKGGIRLKWVEEGYEKGRFRYPLSDEIKINGGVYQQFQGGRIYWNSSASLAASVYGGVQDRYLEIGGSTSSLGYPLTEEIKISNGVYQQFENGRIYWSSDTKGWDVRGGIYKRYKEVGGSASNLGYPTSSEFKLDSGGVYQQFEGGRIYWSSEKGATIMRKGIMLRYTTMDNGIDSLGLPSGDERKMSNGVYQQFENGRIYWSSDTKGWDVRGAIGLRYASLGAGGSFLAFPTGSESAGINSSYQTFENGRIYWSSDTAAQTAHGGILAKYLSIGGHESQLGLPTTGEIKSADSVTQTYQGGKITWKNSKATVNYSP